MLSPLSPPYKLISIVAVSGHRNGYLSHKSVAIGVEGDLDHKGQQRWYDSPETLMVMHPEIDLVSNRIDGSEVVCSKGISG